MSVQIILGWPFVTVALILSALGLFKRNHVLIFFSALLITPFSFYLGGGFGIWHLAFFIPFFQFYAAFMIRKEKRKRALLFTMPMFFFSVWTAFLVLTQEL